MLVSAVVHVQGKKKSLDREDPPLLWEPFKEVLGGGGWGGAVPVELFLPLFAHLFICWLPAAPPALALSY